MRWLSESIRMYRWQIAVYSFLLAGIAQAEPSWHWVDVEGLRILHKTNSEFANIPSDDLTVTICHFSDIHAHLETPTKTFHSDYNKSATEICDETGIPISKVLKLRALLSSEECRKGLSVFGGDVFTGSDYDLLHNSSWAADILTPDLVDSWIMGNHEVNNLWDNLLSLWAKTKDKKEKGMKGFVPLMGSNFEFKDPSHPYRKNFADVFIDDSLMTTGDRPVVVRKCLFAVTHPLLASVARPHLAVVNINQNLAPILMKQFQILSNDCFSDDETEMFFGRRTYQQDPRAKKQALKVPIRLSQESLSGEVPELAPPLRVLGTHIGISLDKELASQLIVPIESTAEDESSSIIRNVSMIHVILGGHSHTFLSSVEYPFMSGSGIPISHTGAYNTYFGILNFKLTKPASSNNDEEEGSDEFVAGKGSWILNDHGLILIDDLTRSAELRPLLPTMLNSSFADQMLAKARPRLEILCQSFDSEVLSFYRRNVIQIVQSLRRRVLGRVVNPARSDEFCRSGPCLLGTWIAESMLSSAKSFALRTRFPSYRTASRRDKGLQPFEYMIPFEDSAETEKRMRRSRKDVYDRFCSEKAAHNKSCAISGPGSCLFDVGDDDSRVGLWISRILTANYKYLQDPFRLVRTNQGTNISSINLAPFISFEAAGNMRSSLPSARTLPYKLDGDKFIDDVTAVDLLEVDDMLSGMSEQKENTSRKGLPFTEYDVVKILPFKTGYHCLPMSMDEICSSLFRTRSYVSSGGRSASLAHLGGTSACYHDDVILKAIRNLKNNETNITPKTFVQLSSFIMTSHPVAAKSESEDAKVAYLRGRCEVFETPYRAGRSRLPLNSEKHGLYPDLKFRFRPVDLLLPNNKKINFKGSEKVNALVATTSWIVSGGDQILSPSQRAKLRLGKSCTNVFPPINLATLLPADVIETEERRPGPWEVTDRHLMPRLLEDSFVTEISSVTRRFPEDETRQWLKNQCQNFADYSNPFSND